MDREHNFEEQKQRFLLFAAHSLQTPLMIISGYAQAIEQNRIPAEEAARVILDQCGRLYQLTGKMFLFSGLDERAARAELSARSLTAAVSSLLERGIFATGETRVRFSPAPEPDDRVLMTEELLELILDNLITNALRYAKESVLVSTRSEGPWLCLDVADDGNGIPEEELPYLFELFYKGRNGQHGLGLPLAQKAAEFMGGRLTAANCPGGGALFTLRLPRALGSPFGGAVSEAD